LLSVFGTGTGADDGSACWAGVLTSCDKVDRLWPSPYMVMQIIIKMAVIPVIRNLSGLSKKNNDHLGLIIPIIKKSIVINPKLMAASIIILINQS
jgi:hypothetical protein